MYVSSEVVNCLSKLSLYLSLALCDQEPVPSDSVDASLVNLKLLLKPQTLQHLTVPPDVNIFGLAVYVTMRFTFHYSYHIESNSSN